MTRCWCTAPGPRSRRCRDHGDVLVVDTPDLVRRQAVPLGAKAVPAIAVLAGMIVLLALGLVPAAVAGLLAATFMVLLRVVIVEPGVPVGVVADGGADRRPDPVVHGHSAKPGPPTWWPAYCSTSWVTADRDW